MFDLNFVSSLTDSSVLAVLSAFSPVFIAITAVSVAAYVVHSLFSAARGTGGGGGGGSAGEEVIE